MTAVVVVLLSLIPFMLLLATSEKPPLQSSCVPELISISPCLLYVSAPPNNMTETVTSQCCDAVSSAFKAGDGDCLCYLLRQPLIFGFPLNKTRVLSLSSVCNTSSSFESLCSSGSPTLPPFSSRTKSDIPKPADSGHDNASAPSKSLPPESARSSSTAPGSFVHLARCPFPTKQIFEASSLFLRGILTFLVFIHM